MISAGRWLADFEKTAIKDGVRPGYLEGQRGAAVAACLTPLHKHDCNHEWSYGT